MTQITASVAKDGGGLAPLPVCGGVLFVSLVFCLLSFILPPPIFPSPPPGGAALSHNLDSAACLSLLEGQVQGLGLGARPTRELQPKTSAAAREEEEPSSNITAPPPWKDPDLNLRGGGAWKGRGRSCSWGVGGGEHRKTALICGVIINGSNTPPEERAL